MQLIFNRNRTATEASTAAHWLGVPCEVSALTCQSRRTSTLALCWAVSVRAVQATTGAAASPSSADSWSIGFREPRPMSARMQSGLSDLGRARWEQDEISIQNRAFFNLYILAPAQSVILFSLSCFSVSRHRCFSRDARFFPNARSFFIFPFSSMTCWVQGRIYPPGWLAQCQPRHFSIVFLFTFQCELILCQHH